MNYNFIEGLVCTIATGILANKLSPYFSKRLPIEAAKALLPFGDPRIHTYPFQRAAVMWGLIIGFCCLGFLFQNWALVSEAWHYDRIKMLLPLVWVSQWAGYTIGFGFIFKDMPPSDQDLLKSGWLK